MGCTAKENTENVGMIGLAWQKTTAKYDVPRATIPGVCY